MKTETQLVILVAVFMATVVVASERYLAERPSFLNPCKQTDPNFERCFGNNFQVVFSEWKDGIPGLKSIGSLEPLYVKRISVVQDNNNPVAQLNVELTDINTSGISKMKVKEISFDSAKLTMKLIYSVPKLVCVAQYAVKGHILNLALDGNGPSTIMLDDVEITMAIRFKRRDEHGLIFFDIDKLRLEITKIGALHIQMDNLFNGLKELEDSTNAVINQNWRALYEVLGPAINNGIQTVLTQRFKKIFAYVPVSYYLEYPPTTNY